MIPFIFAKYFFLSFPETLEKRKNNAAEFLLFSDIHQNILHLFVFMLPLCCCNFSKWLSLCSLSMHRWLAHCCRESTGSFIGVLMGMTQIQNLFMALACFLTFIILLDPHALFGNLTHTPKANCALLVPETCCTATWLSGCDPWLLCCSIIFIFYKYFNFDSIIYCALL